MFLLAAPSTPNDVIDKVIDLIEQGERVSYQDVRDQITKHEAKANKPTESTQEERNRENDEQRDDRRELANNNVDKFLEKFGKECARELLKLVRSLDPKLFLQSLKDKLRKSPPLSQQG